MKRPPSRSAPLATVLQRTVTALAIAEADLGAVQLARKYAAAIDAEAAAPVLCESCESPMHVPYAASLDRLGPKLLAVLVELGATPGARKAVRSDHEPAGTGPAAGLDALRVAGDQGLDQAAAIYAALEEADAGDV